MTSNAGITEYRAAGIGEFPDAQVLEPPPALAGWTSFVAHRAVRALAGSRRGDVTWIATWGGVLAWRRAGDPYSYRRYSTEHGLAGAPSCIAVDAVDTPWVGHDEGGLSRFEDPRWWPHADLRDEPIRAICAATDGGVWAAGATGIYRVRPDTPTQEVSGGHPGGTDAIAVLADGDAVLVGSAQGLFRMSARGAPEQLLAELVPQCTTLARSNGVTWVGTAEGVVRWTDAGATLVKPERGDAAPIALSAGRDGVWVLTRSGVAHVRQEAWTALRGHDQVPPARAITAGPSDDYAWIGTDDLMVGVRARGDDVRWDLALLPRHPEDELSNLGRSVVTAGTPSRTWIATGGGVFVADPDDTWRYDGDLGDIRRMCVSEAPGVATSVWILSWPSGVMRSLASERLWKHVPLPPGFATDLAIGIDRSAHALVAGALWRLDAIPVIVAPHVPEHARALAQTPDGVWWVAATGGVFHWDGGRWTSGTDRPAHPTPGQRPSSGPTDVDVLVVVRGVLWAGGASGLLSRDAGGWRLHRLHVGGSDLHGPVTAIAPAADATTLWIGVGARVVRYDPASGAVRDVYDRFDAGLCGGAISGLAETPSALWVASHGGISRLTTNRRG